MKTLRKINVLVLGLTLALGTLPPGSSVKAEEGVSWLEQAQMSVEDCLSQHASTPIANILDGDKNTLWSTDWTGSGDEYPADVFTINLGELKDNVSQVKYTPRQDDINGKVKKYQILTGETKDDMEVAAGGYWEFSDTDRGDNEDKYATFASRKAQYITLRVWDTSINVSGGETKHTTTCAEFNVGEEEGVASGQEELSALILEAKDKIAVSEDVDYKEQLQEKVDKAEADIAELGVLANEDAAAYIEGLKRAIAGELELKVSVKYVPSEASGYESAKMLDGDKSTFFESSWADESFYFEAGDYLVFDLGKTVSNLSKITYTPRQDSQNGRVKRHRIWTSNENLEGVDVTGEQEFLDEHFEYMATGLWDVTSMDDYVSSFRPVNARYIALQAFSIGGDGNTIGCAEMQFGQGADVDGGQGRIAELITELKEIKEASDKSAVVDAIEKKLSEVEGETFTPESVVVIEKELQKMVDLYTNVGNVTEIKSGEVWLDTDGAVIQAHSGNINYDEKTKTYYWYGDHKGTDNVNTGATSGNPAVGVSCYSSKDLYNWKNEGVVFPVFNNPQLVDGSEPNDDYPLYLSEETEEYKNSPLQEFPGYTSGGDGPVVAKAPFPTLSQYSTPEFIEEANALYEGMSYEDKRALYLNFNWNKVVERPKVMYNESTGKYVMWWHQDGPASGQYYDAMGGVAVSDSPVGPFKFLGTKRLLPDNPTDAGMLRDMNVFVDDDGTGYLIYASEENATTIIHRLNEEYTDVAGTEEGKDWVKVFAGDYREAPAVFQEGDTYYMVTSGQSGWNPNPCKWSWVKGDIMSTDWAENKTFCVGDYDLSGNPVSDPNRGTTFHSQSTFILPVRDTEGNKIPGQYVYIGDRWIPNDLKDSRYIWLPLEFDAEAKAMTMEWKDAWKFEEVFPGQTEEPEMPLKITGVTKPEGLEVKIGTAFKDLKLPHSVTALLENGEERQLEVRWKEEGYVKDREGKAILTGELVLTEEVENPEGIEAEIDVTVVKGSSEPDKPVDPDGPGNEKPGTEKPLGEGNQKPGNGTTDKVQTGDTVNTGVWVVLAVAAIGLAGAAGYRKRKR